MTSEKPWEMKSEKSSKDKMQSYKNLAITDTYKQCKCGWQETRLAHVLYWLQPNQGTLASLTYSRIYQTILERGEPSINFRGKWATATTITTASSPRRPFRTTASWNFPISTRGLLAWTWWFWRWWIRPSTSTSRRSCPARRRQWSWFRTYRPTNRRPAAPVKSRRSARRSTATSWKRRASSMRNRWSLTANWASSDPPRRDSDGWSMPARGQWWRTPARRRRWTTTRRISSPRWGIPSPPRRRIHPTSRRWIHPTSRRWIHPVTYRRLYSAWYWRPPTWWGCFSSWLRRFSLAH